MRAYENGGPPPLRFRERWPACPRPGPCTCALAGEWSLSSPPENGRCIVPEHTIWGDPGVGEDRVVRQVPLVSGQRVPAIADHGPLTEAAVNAMQLGVREREHGGVARGLDMPPLFPVPGPKAIASTEPPQAGGRHCAKGWATGLVNPAGAVAISRR